MLFEKDFIPPWVLHQQRKECWFLQLTCPDVSEVDQRVGAYSRADPSCCSGFIKNVHVPVTLDLVRTAPFLRFFCTFCTLLPSRDRGRRTLISGRGRLFGVSIRGTSPRAQGRSASKVIAHEPNSRSLGSEQREEREETKETPCRTQGPRRSSARSTPSRGYCSWCVCSHVLMCWFRGIITTKIVSFG